MRCCEPLRILSLSLLFCIGVLGAPIKIVLHDTLYKDQLHLKDIASIQSQNSALGRFLGSLKVDAKALEDGVVDAKEIKSLLKRSAIALDQVSIQGRAKVLYPKRELIKEDIQRAVQAFLTQKFPHYKLKHISFAFTPLKLQRGRYRIEFVPTTKSLSHIYLKALIYDGERIVKRLKITVYADYIKHCAFSARDIPKGKIIETSDIVLKPLIIRSSAQECLKPKDVLGAVAKRYIRKERALKRYYIEPDYLVKKGSNVKIVYQKGAISIELLGFALQSGNRGDMIKVKNLSSNKVLRCEVISNGVVRFVY